MDLGVGFLQQATLLRRICLLLIGVTYVDVKRKLWIILLLHCKFAHNLWSKVFLLRGVQWVMPKTVVSLLSTWWNQLGIHSSNFWNMVSACLMWLTQKERNAQTFEEIERLVDRVKSLLLRTFLEWSHIWGFTHCISLFQFLNSVSFSI